MQHAGDLSIRKANVFYGLIRNADAFGRELHRGGCACRGWGIKAWRCVVAQLALGIGSCRERVAWSRRELMRTVENKGNFCSMRDMKKPAEWGG